MKRKRSSLFKLFFTLSIVISFTAIALYGQRTNPGDSKKITFKAKDLDENIKVMNQRMGVEEVKGYCEGSVVFLCKFKCCVCGTPYEAEAPGKASEVEGPCASCGYRLENCDQSNW